MPSPQIMNDEELSNLMQRQCGIVSRARRLDIDFLKSTVTSSKIHEILSTSMIYVLIGTGDAGPATNTRYKPLIHLTPSDRSTIKTIILEAQALTASCGQPVVDVTAGHQLYRVIVAIIWATIELCSSIIVCLTGITLTVQRVLHGFKYRMRVLNSRSTSTHRVALSISIFVTDPYRKQDTNNLYDMSKSSPSLPIKEMSKKTCDHKSWQWRAYQRRDIDASHEEADVLIINQALPLAKQGPRVHVLCDDTDVFAFLVHFDVTKNIPALSQPRGQGLPSTLLHKHKDITPHIPPLHAFTGCGMVSSIFRIGTIKAIKTFNRGCMPPNFGTRKLIFNVFNRKQPIYCQLVLQQSISLSGKLKQTKVKQNHSRWSLCHQPLRHISKPWSNRVWMETSSSGPNPPSYSSTHEHSSRTSWGDVCYAPLVAKKIPVLPKDAHGINQGQQGVFPTSVPKL